MLSTRQQQLHNNNRQQSHFIAEALHRRKHIFLDSVSDKHHSASLWCFIRIVGAVYNLLTYLLTYLLNQSVSQSIMQSIICVRFARV